MGTPVGHFPPQESTQETLSAAEAVAGAVSGKDLTEQDLRRVARQVQNDPEAKQAVESISGALRSPGSGVKYCPIDGRRYDAHFSRCPEHNVPLKDLEE